MDDGEPVVLRGLQVPHVDLVTGSAHDVLLAERQHIRRRPDLVGGQDRRAREEG